MEVSWNGCVAGTVGPKCKTLEAGTQNKQKKPTNKPIKPQYKTYATKEAGRSQKHFWGLPSKGTSSTSSRRFWGRRNWWSSKSPAAETLLWFGWISGQQYEEDLLEAYMFTLKIVVCMGAGINQMMSSA